MRSSKKRRYTKRQAILGLEEWKGNPGSDAERVSPGQWLQQVREASIRVPMKGNKEGCLPEKREKKIDGLSAVCECLEK